MSLNITSTDIDSSKFTVENFINLKSQFPNETDDLIAIYLCAKQNDISKAVALLTKRQIFLSSIHYPILKMSCMNEMEVGKLYINGTDKEGHPLFIWHAKKNIMKDRDLEERMKLVLWWCEYMISFLPDNRTKFTVLIDRTDQTPANIDLEFIQLFAKHFQDLYPERLHRAIVHPTGLVFYGIWSAAKLFFDPITRDKVCPMLMQIGIKDFIEDEFIPVHMGGSSTYQYDPEDFPEPYSPEIVALGRTESHQEAAITKGSLLDFFQNQMSVEKFSLESST
eukprot:gene4551-6423_t